MGPFRPIAGSRRFHRQIDFTESVVETVPNHVVQTELTHKEFATLDRYSYGRRLLGLTNVSLAMTFLNLPAQASALYSPTVLQRLCFC